MAQHITGIVLAAGRGSRFDPSGQRYKLTQRLPDGRTVIAASCASIAQHVDALVVVAGEQADQLRQCLDQWSQPMRVVYCADAALGMGATLKAGIRSSGATDAWLIGLGDMPFIDSGTIAAVCASLRQGDRLVRPVYCGKPGHPVGIASALRDDLLGLPDQTGAASLLRRRQDDVVQIDVDDPGSIMDIDYPTDLPGR